MTGLSNTANPAKAKLTIARAEAYAGLENLESATILVDGVEVAGDARSLFKVSSAGDLVMKFGTAGFVISFR